MKAEGREGRKNKEREERRKEETSILNYVENNTIVYTINMTAPIISIIPHENEQEMT